MMTRTPQPAEALLPALAADRDVDGRLRDILQRAVPVIVELAQADEPQALFLSGSARWGEFVAVTDGRSLHPLSDIDLFLVSKRRTPGVIRALDHGLATWFAGAFPEPWTGSPLAVGTYALPDLPRQHPTLGVAELRRAGCCLWGDAGALSRFPDPEGEGIERWEIVRLLLNRSLELIERLAAAEGEIRGMAALEREYALAKLGSDLATALLASAGSPSWGGVARARRLSEAATARGWPTDLAEAVEESTGRRLAPAPPGKARLEAWNTLSPLGDVLPWLCWTWEHLVDSWDASREDPRFMLAWEQGGLRDRLRGLRRALGHRPDGFGIVGTKLLWWGCRPARSFRTALGWSCLRLLLSMGREGDGDGGSARELRPWIARREGSDPRSAMRRLAAWAAWVREVES